MVVAQWLRTVQYSAEQCSTVLFLVLRACYSVKPVKPVRNVSYLSGLLIKVRFLPF